MARVASGLEKCLLEVWRMDWRRDIGEGAGVVVLAQCPVRAGSGGEVRRRGHPRDRVTGRMGRGSKAFGVAQVLVPPTELSLRGGTSLRTRKTLL